MINCCTKFVEKFDKTQTQGCGTNLKHGCRYLSIYDLTWRANTMFYKKRIFIFFTIAMNLSIGKQVLAFQKPWEAT